MQGIVGYLHEAHVARIGGIALHAFLQFYILIPDRLYYDGLRLGGLGGTTIS